ncbi:MAG TPA: hypothetical protein VFF68_05290, partial [Anaerolineaceae bacterium]|nr:hypothetical protein [Anaerolineaceae bacterium]
MKNRKQIALLIPLILFLVVGGLWMRGTAAPSDAFVETPLPTGEAGRITALQEALAAENLSPDAECSLREKLEMAERMRTQQEAGAKFHSTKVPLPEMEQALAAPASASTPQPFPDVIFEGSEGLVRPGEATIINGFEGQRNGKIVQVLAGSL